MTTYSLFTNRFKYPDRGSLFHSKGFFDLHDNGTGRYYEWLDENGAFAACIHFIEIEKKNWRSPARGTFAGFDFERSLPVNELARFLAAIESDLKSAGANTIEVWNPPAAHDLENFSILSELFATSGFTISRSDLNFTIDVTTIPLHKRMRETQNQRIKKCLKKGFTAGSLAIQNLPIVYQTIAANAALKGFSLSMTFDQLKTMSDAISDSLVLFGVWDDAVLASAGVCVRLSPDILYILYVGDHEGYMSDSPVVMLVDAIYAYAAEQGFSLLDYGTATIGPERDEGLINFKRRLGFVECLKLRMKKVL